MKTVKLIIIVTVLIVFGFSSTLQAQNSMNMNMPSSKTETLKVWGNCEMCKTRIEDAVKEEGATNATWDQKTKLLTLTFNPSKTSLDAFGKKLASVGHDTENYRADDKVYEALPACCKYERAAAAQKADYTCPMHPEVHSDKPGKCPKCGMPLVKKDAAKTDASKSKQSMSSMR
jgi:mercuric ion binding protein